MGSPPTPPHVPEQVSRTNYTPFISSPSTRRRRAFPRPSQRHTSRRTPYRRGNARESCIAQLSSSPNLCEHSWSNQPEAHATRAKRLRPLFTGFLLISSASLPFPPDPPRRIQLEYVLPLSASLITSLSLILPRPFHALYG